MAVKSASPAAARLLDEVGFDELPSTWSIVRIEDLLSENRGISVGVMYPGDHDPAGIPLIKAGDLAGNRINARPNFRITPDKHHEYRRTQLEGGELLISLVGEIGRCAIVPREMAGWNAARAIAVLRFTEPNDAAFVRACLMCAQIQHLMQAWATTTVQATLNLKEIRQIPLPWPPKDQRDAIAHILGTLDDKIDLNRRMSETLETMARSLFKSWFVDFDPVRAKMEGRDPGLPERLAELFPDRLVDSELGEIPEGWEVCCIGDVADLDKGLSYKGEALSVEGGLPLVGLGCFAGDGKFKPENVRRYCGEYRDRHVVRAGDLVIANTDVTQNRVILGSPALLPVLTGERQYLFSHHTFAVRFKFGADRWKHHVYFSLLRPEFREIAEGYATGTTVLALPRDGVLRYQVVLPTEQVRTTFERYVGAFIGRMAATNQECSILTALRDALLPKLVSGELRVTDAERFCVRAEA